MHTFSFSSFCSRHEVIALADDTTGSAVSVAGAVAAPETDCVVLSSAAS